MIPLVFFSFFGKLKWMKIHTHTVVAIKSTFFVVVTLESHITAFMGKLISYQLQLQWGAGVGWGWRITCHWRQKFTFYVNLNFIYKVAMQVQYTDVVLAIMLKVFDTFCLRI